MPDLFEKVRLRDGTIGTIAEVLEPGVAYLFEYETPDGPDRFEVSTVYQGDIDSTVPASGIVLGNTADTQWSVQAYFTCYRAG